MGKTNKQIIQKVEFLRIMRQYSDNKNLSFIREATNYLTEFPHDTKMRYSRARAYRKQGLVKESIADLKIILNYGKNDSAIKLLFFNYYYLNMYDEAIELLPMIYKMEDAHKVMISLAEQVMKTQLNINMKVRRNTNVDYLRSQIFSYSTQSALECVNKHIDSADSNISVFSPKIDVDKLFEVITSNIDNTKKVNEISAFELHCYTIPNIGYIDGNVCNFLRVVVIPNTRNIITMYPVQMADRECEILDVDYGIFYKESSKVKTFSNIEKFNKKYKRV